MISFAPTESRTLIDQLLAERARERADEYAEAARDCLDDLPESEHCEALRAIPAYVLERDR